MDSFQTRPTTTPQTITPKQAITLVQQLAATNYGPIGPINFEFIPLREDGGAQANWDLAFRPSPSNAEPPSARRRAAIQRAIAEVRATHPQIRWP
ncbi:hypothetical protein CXZ10_15370 [Pleomorphomonas diazotrophica]|uniref:Uncharacterized protein n=2 Tax=Pleomorphomonas diazotrophica TaxID=1166257 RepID=A0A1I4UK36_9HYPH|nr:hypothetical protein [Pleomorphomonas diazotrophica]PKR88396.1 hypothetical protein CXZ10_15370 [Pleomorphomonas diazotrophica]SFM89372.1 hypothetical protein SAMN05192571_108112 [Pleomorphomonas diazotrophica]